LSENFLFSFTINYIGLNAIERFRELFGHLSLLRPASGSLNLGGLSTPFLEYSLHRRAAAAALSALSLASSSTK
jgi:hypothetical protein